MKNFYLVILYFVFLITDLSAAEVNVGMFNKLNGNTMVFDPLIVNVDINDTVLWTANDKGHNVEFIKKGVPEGVDKFKSKVGKDTDFTFTIPGIYAYQCTPHKTLGMIAFIVVGDDFSNIENIKKLKFLGKSKKTAKILIEELEKLSIK
jgi:pseudoazurin